MILLSTHTVVHNKTSHQVTVHLRTLTEVIASRKATRFNGQKIIHPFERANIKNTHIYLDNFVSDKVKKDVQAEDTEFTFKHDGGCAFAQYDEKTDTYTPYTRRDIHGKVVDNVFKPGKMKGKGDKRVWMPNTDKIPDDWIPCSESPTDPHATHWTFWRPIDTKDDKHYRTAWFNMLESQMLGGDKGDTSFKDSFTFEWLGKMFNGCPSDQINTLCGVPHGSIVYNIPVELRTMTGFRAVFQQLFKDDSPGEGLIIDAGHTQYKIRADVFDDGTGTPMNWKKNEDGSYRKPFVYPGCNYSGMSDYAAIVKHEECDCDVHSFRSVS